MAPALSGSHSSAWCSGHKAIPNKEWFGDGFNCLDLFPNGYRQGRKTNWSPIKSFNQGNENSTIKSVQAKFIYFIHL
jgi:hypothetical protein